MPGPFIFIATNRLRDGRFDAERRRVPELSGFIEAHEPRLIAFNEYVNEHRSEVTVVRFTRTQAYHGIPHQPSSVTTPGRPMPRPLPAGATGIQVFGTPTEHPADA